VRKAGVWAVSIERANHRSEWPETLRVQFRRFADNSAKWKVPSKTKLWPTIRQNFDGSWERSKPNQCADHASFGAGHGYGFVREQTPRVLQNVHRPHYHLGIIVNWSGPGCATTPPMVHVCSQVPTTSDAIVPLNRKEPLVSE